MLTFASAMVSPARWMFAFAGTPLLPLIIYGN